MGNSMHVPSAWLMTFLCFLNIMAPLIQCLNSFVSVSPVLSQSMMGLFVWSGMSDLEILLLCFLFFDDVDRLVISFLNPCFFLFLIFYLIYFCVKRLSRFSYISSAFYCLFFLFHFAQLQFIGVC